MRLSTAPLTFLLTLFLLATGRWGSYIGVPGTPIYIGDVAVVLAALQLVAALVMRRVTLRTLGQAPLVLLLVLSVLGYAFLRLVFGADLSLVVLRDFAPYGYAVVAALAFITPIREERRWRPAVYAVLAAHALWVVALPRVPGFPWQLPVLGSDATLLVARPDFDTTVLGVGCAFALNDLIRTRRGRRSRLEASLLCALITVSVFGLVTMGTRAGLLAGLVAIAAVVSARYAPAVDFTSRDHERQTTRTIRAAAVLAGAAIVLGAVGLTPAGDRLLAGISDASSGAYGTVAARKSVWDRVGTYVLHDAERTAVGVGFGRNFIAESGSDVALEGTAYQNVRSPHNYVLGTLARLGVAGALMVSLIIALGWWQAISALRRPTGPVTTLAALLVLSLPVIALLGVVLESPFGAIPYFWALGQLSVLGASPTLAPPARQEPK